jgi:hypothetical protein
MSCVVTPLQAIMKSQTTTTEEDIHVPVAEHREPWTLPGSIFKPRVKESDARAFYDGPAVSGRSPSRATRAPMTANCMCYKTSWCPSLSLHFEASLCTATMCLTWVAASVLQSIVTDAAISTLCLQTLEKLFSRDWQRACGKEKFTTMLARENKGNAAGKTDKVAMQEVQDILKKHYQVSSRPKHIIMM